MPELPEVETFRRNLNLKILGKRVRSIELFRETLLKNADFSQIKKALTGRTIKTVARRGKYLIVQFDNDYSLLFHLRMTGGFSLNSETVERPQIRFQFTDDTELFFDDRRNLSTLHLALPGKVEDLHPIGQLGVEPLSSQFSWETLSKLLRSSQEIKRFLLDQKKIVGLGNIYASEVLFLSKIHPQRPANQLTLKQAKALFEKIPQILQHAIDLQGTSIINYRDLSGTSGSFQEELFVYGREGKPCRNCGTSILRIVQGGRSSFFCPKCQKNR